MQRSAKATASKHSACTLLPQIHLTAHLTAPGAQHLLHSRHLACRLRHLWPLQCPRHLATREGGQQRAGGGNGGVCRGSVQGPTCSGGPTAQEGEVGCPAVGGGGRCRQVWMEGKLLQQMRLPQRSEPQGRVPAPICFPPTSLCTTHAAPLSAYQSSATQLLNAMRHGPGTYLKLTRCASGLRRQQWGAQSG